MYNVVTRLDGNDLPAGLNLVDKALLYDRGFLRRGDERLEKDDFGFDDDSEDGRSGIPVTYPRDIIADLLNEGTDRSHPELDVENVVTPSDVLDEMVERLADEPMFSTRERNDYKDRVEEVRGYVLEKQERDVLDAATLDVRVDDEAVEEYVEHVYAWAEDEKVETPRGEEEPDLLKMKVFETEHLGRFGDDDYDGNEPSVRVERFRRDKIVTAMNVQAWRKRDEGFAGGFDAREIPVMQNILTTYDWEDVRRIYEDFDPVQWEDPPSGTETERVKEKTTTNLVEEFGYSPASAELTSRRVVEEVAERWD